MRFQETVIERSKALEICENDPKQLPPPGYMLAARVDGQLGWLKCLYVSEVFIFRPVDSFRFGVGIGAIRKMFH
jgi:hypothetical protein